MSTTRTIDTLSPLQRIERRLIGNVVGAQNSVEYWQGEVERLRRLPVRLLSSDQRSRDEFIAKRELKVLHLQAELAQATEELDAFRELCGVVK